MLSLFFVSFNQSNLEVEVFITDEVASEKDTKLMVDVAGPVEKPGVYELDTGARVDDTLVAYRRFIC